MAGVWGLGRGLTVKEAEGERFLFQFYHKMDVQRVLKGGLWSFDGHLLILGTMQEGGTPKEVDFFNVSFWVQVHQVPVGFMTEAVGKHLANFWENF